VRVSVSASKLFTWRAARSEFAQCLALTAIANIGGKQMAEAQLAPSVTKLLLAK
jgi:hypothetical protein